MKCERSAGILLHPTCLPGIYGIGDIGPQAYRWVDFLAEAGCSLWQLLPLGPTGYGDSPYQCFSAFAGNPYLISPEALLAEGLLHSDDLVDAPQFPSERVDFGVVIPWKLGVLDRSFGRFEHLATSDLRAEFDLFRDEESTWLGDFSLFMALKEAYGGGSWVNWPVPLRRREPQALVEARHIYAYGIKRQEYRQFIFFRQWKALRAYAAERGICIIGDIPIFVAHDSAEVWAQPELFFLDPQGNPTVVAGVPPDYFTKTGQRWGNPLYRWNVHAADKYSWWVKRLQSVLSLVDIVRLDHFRGFAGYWEVPASAKTAELGRWVPGPGAKFFQAIEKALGDLPIIAEDLGEITPDVIALRDKFGLPGMRIVQFAFHNDPTEPFLPHNYIQNCVVYTGTHDNDTSRGWFERVPEVEKEFCQRYIGHEIKDIAWEFIRLAWASVAVFTLAPLQDLLSLSNEARMNYPGNPSGNWSWRMPGDALTVPLLERLKEFNYLYHRDRRTSGE